GERHAHGGRLLRGGYGTEFPGQGPPAVVGPDGVDGPAAGTDLEGPGHDAGAVELMLEPFPLLRRAAEFGEGQRGGRDGGPQRHRCDTPPLLLEERGEPEHAHARAARAFRDRDAEKVGPGERPPQVLVEAARLLDGGQGGRVGAGGEDLPRQLPDAGVVLGEIELHGYFAPVVAESVRRRADMVMPRVLAETISRITSLVPPP